VIADAQTDGLHIHVDPEPRPEELAAIVAAIGQLARELGSPGEPASPSLTPGRDRWARAGRREILRPIEWERDPTPHTR
jgi:hypothetical protein